MWEMNGTKPTDATKLGFDSGFQAIGTGDFNGDSFSDILTQNTSTGQVSIWEMNGTHLLNSADGTFDVSAIPGPSWHAIGTGDFDADGHSDILLQNTSSGQASIWEMNGNALIGGGALSANPGPAGMRSESENRHQNRNYKVLVA